MSATCLLAFRTRRKKKIDNGRARERNRDGVRVEENRHGGIVKENRDRESNGLAIGKHC